MSEVVTKDQARWLRVWGKRINRCPNRKPCKPIAREVYVEAARKSRAGVEYKFYKVMLAPLVYNKVADEEKKPNVKTKKVRSNKVS
jgi:hypothetical protein